MNEPSDKPSPARYPIFIYVNCGNTMWAGIVAMVLGITGCLFIAPQLRDSPDVVTVIGCAAIFLALLFSLHCFWRLLQNVRYSRWTRDGKGYICIDEESVTLLGDGRIPWTSIVAAQIKHLAHPKSLGVYLIIELDRGRPMPRLTKLRDLTRHNASICAAIQGEGGTVPAENSFLSLPLEATGQSIRLLHPFVSICSVNLTRSASAIMDDVQCCLGAAKTGQASESAKAKKMPLAAKTNPAKPAKVGALHAAANTAYQAGLLEEAEDGYRAVLDLAPNHADAHHMLGIVCIMRGDQADAEGHLRRAVELADNAVFGGNLALLLFETKRYDEAELHFRSALKRSPKNLEILGNYANLLKDTMRSVEAETSYRRLIVLDPASVLGHNNLGLVLQRTGNYQEAERCYRRVLVLDPLNAEAYNNLGVALKSGMRLAEAEAALRRALEILPEYPGALNNLGLLYSETSRHGQAETVYRQALLLDPASAEARFNLSITLLASGQYAEAWPAHEARYDSALLTAPVKIPDLPFAQWQGQSLVGKSLLIWPEQGFGDFVQFARYLPLLKKWGIKRLGLVCHPALANLLGTVDGVDAVYTETAAIPVHDYWAFSMSLALHFNTALATIPIAIPYVQTDSARMLKWSARMPGKGMKVGLAWRGQPGHLNDGNRSLPGLAILAPLWKVPGLSFFSLQKGPGEEEALHPPAGQPITALGHDIADLADTAAIVAQLDLLICVDTAVAHVAGALGKPCWVLLPSFGADWRWLEDRSDSPWYPKGMRLIRQVEATNWESTIEEVARDLKVFGQGM